MDRTLRPKKAGRKHKKVLKLLKVFWNEEEIKILKHFDPADKWMTLKQLEERTGIPRKELKSILARSVDIRTIDKEGAKYCLKPIIPGIFEGYFIERKDTEENHIEAAKLYRDILKEVMPQNHYESEFKLFSPLLPIEAEEKLIEINEEYDVETQALPYELVKELIDKNDVFGVIPCQCRLIGELSGEPCEQAPSEMGCFVAGMAAKMIIAQGVPGARLLNKQEAIDFIKDTEKAGLVHNAVYDKGVTSSFFICNCCSCHCGQLFPGKQLHFKGTYSSNYAPKFDMDLCVKCETCIRKCPNDAIYHKWPLKQDSSDEEIVLRVENCLGCGICAANCPKNAIKLVKVRDNIPPDQFKIGNKTFFELV